MNKHLPENDVAFSAVSILADCYLMLGTFALTRADYFDKKLLYNVLQPKILPFIRNRFFYGKNIATYVKRMISIFDTATEYSTVVPTDCNIETTISDIYLIHTLSIRIFPELVLNCQKLM